MEKYIRKDVIMRLIKALFFVFVMVGISLASNEPVDNWQIKPLADDYVTLYKSPDANKVPLYDPGIAVCPNGRLIGTFSIAGLGSEEVEIKEGKRSEQGRIYTSDDDGKTWKYRSSFPMWHFTPFVAGEKLYILGHKGDLRIISSDDWGDTWSSVYHLTYGQKWHGSATNVWYKGDYVYIVMERRMGGEMKGGWKISECAPVLLRGNIKKDLTKRKNWTFSSEMSFRDVVDDKELDWFGVPFWGGYYPDIKRRIGGKGNFPPIGWLEANVVQITDPKHYWYDPEGKTFHIFLRAHTGITNLACMIKAVEKADGTIETMLQKAPSGKKHLYLPFPGGQNKFSVAYDDKTELYWMVSNQTTDSMTKPEDLPDD
jgi:hypothetical protein